ncbi:MAG: DUF3800 domain-containing protein [Sulfitobacter sp.]|uniref:DUF3800 domain-containing protein n=1 Tax=Alphaproteobacteria TaxID=28211 RepID=UPI003264641C
MDEVGTDDLSCLDNDNHRYLSLTGVIIQLSDVDVFLNPALRNIKREVFETDPDEIVHLHRSDIVRRKKVFGQLNSNAKRELFDGLVLSLVQEADYKVITVLIDKLAMTERRHWENKHPYHYLMEIMVEKYVQFLERQNDIGDIMPEARQGKKDSALQNEYSRIWSDGTRFKSAQDIQGRLRAKSLKFRRKQDNISGLQLCDLIAHASHMYVRSRQSHAVAIGKFSRPIVKVLVEEKYDRSYRGRIEGYGYKYCP